MQDLYNYQALDAAGMGLNAEQIMKAMEAGLQTGRDYNNTDHTGGGLKTESLDAVVKVLESKMTDNVLFNGIGKQRIYNTVHEFNQLKKYGQEVGIFNLEGETPQFTDSQYTRRSVITKFMGVGFQVTHPATLVKTADGKNALAREVENKTALLLRAINRKLSVADSSKIATEFDGIFRQHLIGVNEIYGASAGKTEEQLMDTYFNDSASVIDARGHILTDSLIQDSADGIVNTRFGEVDTIISNPTVFNDYVKQFQQYKQVLVGGVNGVENANMGQSVGTVTTQFGKLNIDNDKFFDRKEPRLYNEAATNAQAPAAPTKDGSTPIAVVSADTKTKFTDGAGGYFYAVAAKNRYGVSAMTPINTTIQAVAATESVDLKFAATAGLYDTEAFVIYRTEKDVTPYTTAKYYPIFEVSVGSLASGFDGAAATLVRDRNRFIPNTYRAMVYYKSNDMLEYLQFCPTMRMDLAQTSPSQRGLILNYGALAMYAPGKVSIIWNIGKKTA